VDKKLHLHDGNVSLCLFSLIGRPNRDGQHGTPSFGLPEPPLLSGLNIHSGQSGWLVSIGTADW